LVASIHQRADVAGLHLVGADRVEHGGAPAGEIQLVLHPVNLAGVDQPDEMFIEPEAGGALRRRVAARALEDAAAVMDDVRRDVNRRVLPFDEPAIHPDLARARKTHLQQLLTAILAFGHLVIWSSSL